MTAVSNRPPEFGPNVPPRRLWRVARGALSTVGLLVTFVAAVVLGVMVHLDMPVTRRVVLARVNPILTTTFRGTLEIQGIERIGLRGASGLSARMLDVDGVPVVEAHDVRARLSVLDVVRSLLGRGDLVISIASVEIGTGAVDVSSLPDGRTRLQAAFTPRATSDGGPGRGVRVHLGDIVAHHVVVKGQLGGLPRLDADVDELRAAVHVVPGEVHVDVAGLKLTARGMPRGANPVGTASGRVALPSPRGQPYAVTVAFRGAIAEIPSSADLWLDGPRVDLVADVPLARAAAIRAIAPEAPVREDATLHAEVRGDLPRLGVHAAATLGSAAADVDGHVNVDDGPSGDVTVDVRGLDVHALAPSAPRSAVAAKVRVAFAIDEAKISGDYDADVARGAVAGIALPRTVVHGDYVVRTGAAAPEITVHGRGRVEEEGAPTTVVYSLAPAPGGAKIVEVEATAKAPRLEATRLGRQASGRATLHAAGRVRLPDASLELVLDGDVDDATRAGVKIGHAHVDGRASGTARALSVSARVDATKLSMGSLDFAEATVAADGSTRDLDVTATLRRSTTLPDLVAHAMVDAGAPLHLRDARVLATHGNVSAEARAADVRVAGGAIDVTGGVVDGLGSPASLELSSDRASTHVRVGAPRIDLARVATLLRLENRLQGGTVALDADVVTTGATARGQLRVDLANGAGFGAKDASLHVDATLAERHIDAHARASLGAVGSVEVRRAALTVAGNAPLGPGSWRETWGDVDVLGRVELTKLASTVRLPAGLSDVDMEGSVELHAVAARPSALGDAPSLQVDLATTGLVLGTAKPTRAPDGTVVFDVSSQRVSGVDVKLAARLDGTSGSASIEGKLVDRRGALVTLDAQTPKLPYGALVGGGDDIDALGRTPISLRVDVPRRPFGTFPIVGADATGDAAGTLTVTGTALAPVVEAAVHLYGVKSQRAPITSKLDADLTARYADGKADAKIDARTPRAKVLEATAHADARVADFLGAGAKADPPWKASANARLTEFPLGAIADLSDRQIHGKASGLVTVERLHDDASAKVHLDVKGLESGTASFQTATVDATLENGALRATAAVARPDASLNARAELGMTWGAALVPSVDPDQPALLTLDAKHFPIDTFSPFVEPALTDLGGKLDAQARFAVPAGGKNAEATGYATVRDGTVQVTSLGQDFHAIQAKVTLSRDGVLRLEDVRAKGTTGLVMATGVARMQGLRLAAARLAVRVPKSAPIPVQVDGVSMGEMYGDIQVAADAGPDPSITNVTIDVPRLLVRLPDSSPHAVQTLDEPQKIRVGMFRAPGRFVLLPIDGEDLRETEGAPKPTTRTNVSVRLGSDVAVVRGQGLRVDLDGNPKIAITDKAHMSGQIRLKSGELEVQGKKFEIEKGTVTFTDDPSNPTVVVTAGWTAPDGTRVLADFTGPLKTGKVRLRSEPGRPQNEILALILFGTATGSSATPYAQPSADGATKAGTAAGGLASEGLSKGLDRLTGLAISTKVDTTDEANPRPEVELQIARDISLQVAFVLGTPPPGTNPDRTFATIDWRFLRNWSLATTFGDQGSSIADVVWRYRY